MSPRFLFLVLCCLVVINQAVPMRATRNEICHPQVGCFEMGEPWGSFSRPMGAPESPEKIQTKVYFYTRQNIHEPIHVSLYPEITINDANFDGKKKSVMIVHGYDSSGDVTWVKDMKNAYLKQVDANVMVVDWESAAANINYLQVVTNLRVIGRQLALFLRYLIKNYKADPGNFHLIGHSLGAHICSYLGKEVPGIGRLTALDPAQLYFEGFPKAIRLDRTDAKFVDVIHTDAVPNFGLGMIAPYGHVDFYVNGGYDQPGCHTPFPFPTLPQSFAFLADITQKILGSISHRYCSHIRAHQYFIEALDQTNGCIFWGRKGHTENLFQSESEIHKRGLGEKIKPVSSICNAENCVVMGLNTEKSPLRGVFVVTTNDKPPYCKEDGDKQAKGYAK